MAGAPRRAQLIYAPSNPSWISGEGRESEGTGQKGRGWQGNRRNGTRPSLGKIDALVYVHEVVVTYGLLSLSSDQFRVHMSTHNLSKINRIEGFVTTTTMVIDHSKTRPTRTIFACKVRYLRPTEAISGAERRLAATDDDALKCNIYIVSSQPSHVLRLQATHFVNQPFRKYNTRHASRFPQCPQTTKDV